MWWSGVGVGGALRLGLSRALFLCTLRVHWLTVGAGSGGGGSVFGWFALGSAHLLDLLLQACLTLLEIVVLIFERGGGSDCNGAGKAT